MVPNKTENIQADANNELLETFLSYFFVISKIKKTFKNHYYNTLLVQSNWHSSF